MAGYGGADTFVSLEYGSRGTRVPGLMTLEEPSLVWSMAGEGAKTQSMRIVRSRCGATAYYFPTIPVSLHQSSPT